MKKWTKHEEEANVVCLIIMRKTIAIHYDKDMINEVWLYSLLLLKVYEEPLRNFSIYLLGLPFMLFLHDININKLCF